MTDRHPATCNVYQGTIMLFDVESGDEINVAVQIAVDADQIVYTMRGCTGEGGPETLTVHDPGRCRGMLELIARMHRVSQPASRPPS